MMSRASTFFTPACTSSSISVSSASGESTTPLPMKQSTLPRRMPEGMRCSTVFFVPMTSVWPALWPPWKRTTPCARSVSQSTILPLPSSPHWVPMTTTLRALICLFDHARDAAQVDREPRRRPRAAERLAHLVVAAAARHRAGHAGAISIEDDSGVIVIAAQLGQIKADRDGAGFGERAQRLQGLGHSREPRQALFRRVEHLRPAVELGQKLQRVARSGIHFLRQAAQLRQVLLLQRFEEAAFHLGAY